MRRLLFLNGIKAFEAAARSGSFAGAGRELNVSAAAVSRMVHLLEQRLGVALFERKANRLAMTAAGRAYQSGLTPIFDALASLTAQVTAPSSVRVLTARRRPDLCDAMADPAAGGFSQGTSPTSRCASPPAARRRRSATTGAAASSSATAQWPGLVAEPLFAADLLPVCAPRLAGAAQAPGRSQGAGLLRVAHSPDDWPLWLKAAGVARVTRARTGISVLRPGAAGRRRRPRHRHGHPALYRRRPRRRRLVAPFALTVPKGMRWYLVYRSFRTEQRDFAAFRRWIIRAAAEPAARGRPSGRAQRHAG